MFRLFHLDIGLSTAPPTILRLSDELLVCELIVSESSEFATDARVLDASEGQVGRALDRRVDPDHPDIKLVGTFMGLGLVATEDCCPEAVRRVVGQVAQRWNLTRAELDEFALQSHQRAVKAIENGHFAAEIVPVGKFDTDEGPRPDTSLERLATLRPVNGPDGLVTAGNSSSLNDGAAAMVIASEAYVNHHGLHPRARIVASASSGVAPEIMGIGPVPATRKALDRARWSTSDLGAIELNEAFASQALACIRDLGLDPETVNSDGGAIALGRVGSSDPAHPPRARGTNRCPAWSRHHVCRRRSGHGASGGAAMTAALEVD